MAEEDTDELHTLEDTVLTFNNSPKDATFNQVRRKDSEHDIGEKKIFMPENSLNIKNGMTQFSTWFNFHEKPK